MSDLTVEGFQLSPQQRRLWQLQEAGDLACRTQCVLEIRGDLEPALLRRAVQQTVARHEILRTRFVTLPGMAFPLQSISDDVSFVGEASDAPEDGLATAPLESLWQELTTLHLDPGRGPVLHYRLVRTAARNQLFGLCVPALCADQAGLLHLAATILRTCAVLRSDPSLGDIGDDESPVQYADVSDWLNELLQSDAQTPEHAPNTDPALPPTSLTLPLERPAQVGARHLPRSVHRELPAQLLDGLRALGREHDDPSIEAVLLAGWQGLLARLASAAHVTLGLACDGRLHAELGNAVGLLERYVPVTVDVDVGQPWTRLAHRAAAALRDARLRQHVVDPAGSGVPQAADALGFEFNAPEVALNPATTAGHEFLSVDVRRVGSCIDRFKVLLSCTLLDGRLALTLIHDRERLSETDAQTLLAQYETLLWSMLHHPALPLERLNLLDDAERERLVVSFNRTDRERLRYARLQDWFAAQAMSTPDAPAVVHAHEQLTYAQLDARANRLARHLQGLGAGPDVPIGVCLDRSPALIVALLGIVKSGAAYVPLDPAYPPARLDFMVRDSGMPLLLTEANHAHIFDACSATVVTLDGADRERIASASEHEPKSAAGPRSLVYVIYTSGSTGQPKGVLIEHRSLLNYLQWSMATYRVGAGDGVPVHSSVSFDATITAIFPALLAGRPITLLTEGQEIEALADLLREPTRHDLVKITPAHLDLLSQMLGEGRLAGKPGCLVVGGEALFAKTARYWVRRMPEARLINEYGPTETVVGCCVYELPSRMPLPSVIPIGRPIANTRLYVLDGHLQPVPAGVPGELYIGGAGVARGYLNRPDLTAERFLPDPYSGQPGARMYKSGDLARHLPDGQLEYLGRLDQQVKVRGYRIEPGEVESALAAFPGIADAVVLAETRSEADANGDAGTRLLAFVTATSDGGRIDTGALRSFLESRLPRFMVPAHFVQLDRLPLTPNGKADRQALLASEALQTPVRAAYAPAETPREVVLCQVWSEVLKLDRVGIDDNFFDVGGDSIRGIQILARLRQAGLSASIEALFEHQTIRSFAAALPATAADETVQASGAAFALLSNADRQKLPPEGLDDAYPMSALQLGMLYHGAYLAGQAVYLDIDTLHLRGPFAEAKLRATLDVMAAQHPVLRTSFDLRRYSEPMQLVHASASIPLQVDDVSHLPSAEQEQLIRDWVQREKDSGFAPGEPPLLRFHVFVRGDASFQLGFVRHHAILDGWSAASLLTGIAQHYADLPVPAGEANARFRDFVALERVALRSSEAQTFWAQKLSGVSVMRLPRRRTGGPATAQRAVRHGIELSADLTTRLHQAARQMQAPLKSVLLAAHMKIMSLLGGQPDVVSGLVSNGRPEDAGGETVLGLFLNALPFRLLLRDGDRWSGLVQQVFQAERELLPYRRFPLSEIQRGQGGQALFEVLFNYVHFHVYDGLAGLPGMEVVEAQSFEETHFTLLVNFSQNPTTQRVHLDLYYDAEALDDDRIRRWAQCYEEVLDRIASDPQERHADVSLLDEAERHQLLVGFNDTAVAYPQGLSLHGLFEAQVQRMPDAVALVWEDVALSYAELNTRANRLAHHLRAQGVDADSRVGVCLQRTPELIVCLLAVLKAGAAYLPLDPQYPRERMAFMLEDAGASLVLAHARFADLLASSSAQICLVDDALAVDQPAHSPEVPVSSDELAYVIYTSGSTGRPKGVAIEHRSAVVMLHWARDTFSAAERSVMLASTSVCFDLSVFEIFVPLSWGGRIVLVDNALHLPSVRDQSALTFVNTVPSAMTELLRLGALPATVQVVGLAGEPLQNALAQGIYRTGVASVYNLYGPSEDTTYSTFVRIEPGSSEAVTIGRPIANSQVYILDAAMRPVPIGVAGELHIGGQGLARGYLNRPELTAEKFVPDPFGKAGGRLYRTGDLARWRADGQLEYLGRMDHQVKVRGYRIELGEIEAALLEQNGVSEALVLVREDTPGDQRLVAYLVADAEVAALRDALKRKLPDYMVPAHFVGLQRLPLTPNGKVDRKALPLPQDAVLARTQAYVAPSGDTELQIAAIWRDVLGLQQVGANDNFFDLGGHSLLLIQAYGRLGDLAGEGVTLTMVDLFTHPTVRSLAAHLDQTPSDRQVQSDSIQAQATRQKQALQKSKQKHGSHHVR